MIDSRVFQWAGFADKARARGAELGRLMNRGATIAAMMALSSSAPAQTEARSCIVQHPRGENGATVTATMSVVNDGTPCVMRMRLGHQAAQSVTVKDRPRSGTLAVGEDSVSYKPKPGFVGKDSFDVQWFGGGFGPNSRSHNVRTRVDVTVRAASDEPDSPGEEPATGEEAKAKSAKPSQ